VHTSFCARWQGEEKVNRRIWGFFGKLGVVACCRERILMGRGDQMDGKRAICPRNLSSQEADSEAKTANLKERLERLLREAAEVEVELSRADGTIRGVPHYSLIEGRAHELGKRLSRQVQQRQMSELAASQTATARCPGCGALVRLQPRQRTVKSVDGDTTLQELVGDCSRCRKSFFPAT
jgi:hypothetical protein